MPITATLTLAGSRQILSNASTLQSTGPDCNIVARVMHPEESGRLIIGRFLSGLLCNRYIRSVNGMIFTTSDAKRKLHVSSLSELSLQLYLHLSLPLSFLPLVSRWFHDSRAHGAVANSKKTARDPSFLRSVQSLPEDAQGRRCNLSGSTPNLMATTPPRQTTVIRSKQLRLRDRSLVWLMNRDVGRDSFLQ